MVDHKTRELSVAELADKVEELRRKVCELDAHAMPLAEAKLVQRVYELETRMSRFEPAEHKRLVPCTVNEDAERDPIKRLLKQIARDRRAKIEQLEKELADAGVDLAKLTELANSRLVAANILRRDLNEMNLKLNGKTTALANCRRDLQEAKDELRRVDGTSARRRAVAAENEAARLREQLAEQTATVVSRDRTVDALSRTVESLRQEIAVMNQVMDEDLPGGEPLLPGLE